MHLGYAAGFFGNAFQVLRDRVHEFVRVLRSQALLIGITYALAVTFFTPFAGTISFTDAMSAASSNPHSA